MTTREYRCTRFGLVIPLQPLSAEVGAPEWPSIIKPFRPSNLSRPAAAMYTDMGSRPDGLQE